MFVLSAVVSGSLFVACCLLGWLVFVGVGWCVLVFVGVCCCELLLNAVRCRKLLLIAVNCCWLRLVAVRCCLVECCSCVVAACCLLSVR